MPSKLATLHAALAEEIREQDWSDAHSRLDGARHNRERDHTTAPQLPAAEVEAIRMNVIWVVAQALANDDPNFDVRSFAEAAGASPRFLLTRDGRRKNRMIEAGIRRYEQDT